MYKFFVRSNQIEDNFIKIIGEDVNHIRNVIRLTIDEKLYICNKDTCKNYICQINKMENENIFCRIIEEVQDTTEPKTYIHILQGLPKSDKFEFVIEKCTEIGIKEITPVVMKRTIIKIDEKDKIKKHERWQKIAEVAAKQAKRDAIPKINNIINFKNIFENIKDYDILLVAYENEKETTLKNILKRFCNDKNLKIAVIIGPEGRNR